MSPQRRRDLLFLAGGALAYLVCAAVIAAMGCQAAPDITMEPGAVAAPAGDPIVAPQTGGFLQAVIGKLSGLSIDHAMSPTLLALLMWQSWLSHRRAVNRTKQGGLQ